MNSDFQNLRSLLSSIYPDGEARAIAFLVFEESFGVSRMDVYADKVRQFSEDERERLQRMSQLLSNGVPVQYVLGHCRFHGHTFSVSPAVLIPRPETEELVDWVVEEVMKKGLRTPRILDAGTGSGCIAISLKLAFPEAEIVAWDISEDALAVARENAHRLQADVTFCKVDMLRPFEQRATFDIIVSNPPYICQREKQEMERNVTEHEPHTALFVPDSDPLQFYRALCGHAKQQLSSGGSLMVELNRAYGEATAKLFKESGLRDVELRKDAFGNERMLLGRRSKVC